MYNIYIIYIYIYILTLYTFICKCRKISNSTARHLKFRIFCFFEVFDFFVFYFYQQFCYQLNHLLLLLILNCFFRRSLNNICSINFPAIDQLEKYKNSLALRYFKIP